MAPPPHQGRSPSLAIAVLVVVGLVVVGSVAVAIGLPMPVALVFVTGVSVALLGRAVATRNLDRAEALDPGALDPYPLRLPAQRWAVGSPWQFRFVPRSRAAWAPGVLGVGYDQVRFVPSRRDRADRAWTGRPTSVEVVKTLQVCAVRFRAPEGDAQFSIQLPADEVRRLLAPMLPVVAD